MRFLVVVMVLVAATIARAETARPWIGIALAPGKTGVRIKEVIADTPGQRAGLRSDDEVISIDGTAVTEPQALIALITGKGIGTTIRIEVVRADKHLTIKLALEARPELLELIRKQLLDKPAPELALADPIGPFPATLTKLKGHVVVVEFWATWCGFCKLTRPTLSGWQKTYGAKGLRVLGIAPDPLDALRKVATDEKLAYTVARDPDDKLSQAYFVPGLPTFIVIDKTGVVRYVGVGAGEGIDGVEPAVKKLLQ